MSPLTHRFSRSTVYVLIALYASMFVLSAVSVVVSARGQDQNNRRWCGVLRVYHEASQNNPPPATQYGKDILAQLEVLFQDFHCDQVKGP